MDLHYTKDIDKKIRQVLAQIDAEVDQKTLLNRRRALVKLLNMRYLAQQALQPAHPPVTALREERGDIPLGYP
jgi:hypothetical protein